MSIPQIHAGRNPSPCLIGYAVSHCENLTGRGMRRTPKKTVHGLRQRVGTENCFILQSLGFEATDLAPCTLNRFAYVAVTRDEGNAALRFYSGREPAERQMGGFQLSQDYT
jgi:hypothetical protein